MNGSFFAVFIVVVVLALVAGVALFGNDLMNPATSAAKAAAMRQVTQSNTDKGAIEWAKAQQQAAIEWDKAQQAAVFQQRQSDQTLEIEAQRHQAELAQMGQRDQIMNSWSPAIVAVILVATLVLTAALAYFLIRSGAARARAPVQVRALVAVQSPALIRALAMQAESWNNLDWRTEQIHQARANETAERWELARQAALAPVAQVESGLPLGPTPPAE